MQYVSNGYEIAYLFPKTRPAMERRRFDPQIGIRTFLIAAAGMLLVAGLFRSSTSVNKAIALDLGTECTLGGCPRTITTDDAPQTLNYPVGAEFTVLLTPGAKSLSLSCTPDGAVMETAFGGPGARRYAALAPGTCLIQSDNFRAKVNVVNAP